MHPAWMIINVPLMTHPVNRSIKSAAFNSDIIPESTSTSSITHTSNSKFLNMNNNTIKLYVKPTNPLESIEVLTETVVKISNNPEKITPINNSRSWLKHFTGILLTLLAGILYTVAVLFVKLLSNYHPFSLSIWRHAAFILPSILMSVHYKKTKKENIFHPFWPIHGNLDDLTERRTMLFTIVVSGFLSALTMILRFYALNFMSLADATVVSFSGPVFSVILGHVFLKEKCGIVTIPIALWTLLGVFVIVRPPALTGEAEFSQDTLIGAGISMASVILVAIYYIILRKMRTINISIVALANGITGLVESIVIACSFGVFSVPEGLYDITLTFLMAHISFLGNITIVLALKYEKAGTVSMIRTADVLFAFLWQILFLNLVPDIYSYLGGTIVVSGVLLITIRKMLSELPMESRGRKMYGFLLK